MEYIFMAALITFLTFCHLALNAISEGKRLKASFLLTGMVLSIMIMANSTVPFMPLKYDKAGEFIIEYQSE